MDRNELIAEIKKQLQGEFEKHRKTLEDQIPEEHLESFEKARRCTRQFVKENPLVSVTLASFAGFYLARLIYKRRD